MTEDQASAGAPAAVLCPVANLLILNFTQDACCFCGLPNGMSSELIPNPVPAVNQAIPQTHFTHTFMKLTKSHLPHKGRLRKIQLRNWGHRTFA